MRTLVMLQNPWSPLWAGGKWDREPWLRALHRSRTGQRLARIWEPPADHVWYDNTSPIVTEKSNGVSPPDVDHIKEVLRIVDPEIVVACGAQAKSVMQAMWQGKLLCMPHPANRLLSNVHLQKVNYRYPKG